MLVLWLAGIVFVGTYVLIASEKVHKTTAAMLGSSIMLLILAFGGGHNSHEAAKVSGLFRNTWAEIQHTIGFETAKGHEAFTPEAIDKMVENSLRYSKQDVYSQSVNFDVIFTLAGMMILVNILSGTGVFQYVAVKCAKLAKGLPVRTMIFLVVATAVLSAFLDNVTTVLLVAPVTLVVASELRVNPMPFLMAETLASNIGGTATLIGDPPNLIIGSAAGLGFNDFLVNVSPIVVLILTIYCIVLYFYYAPRMKVTVEQRARIMEMDEMAAIVDPSNLKRGGTVMIITIIGFLLHGAVGLEPCVVAMGGAALGFVVCKVDIDHALEKVEWSTLFFFMGLFILVFGAEELGLMQVFGKVLVFTEGWSAPMVVLAVMWCSAILAAVMNNVSFTAIMVGMLMMYIQNTPTFSGSELNKELLWWGLSLAVCLGGNGTLVGAAANLVTAGIAQKSGHDFSFKKFLVYGIPVTFGSMVLASAYIMFRFYVLRG